jgi:hypothetical protein
MWGQNVNRNQNFAGHPVTPGADCVLRPTKITVPPVRSRPAGGFAVQLFGGSHGTLLDAVAPVIFSRHSIV